MTLPELCEPLFLYVCRLNRASRKGGELSMERVRNELNISSRSSNLRVFVARDRAIEQHVPIYKSRGIRNKPGGGIPDNAGLPVIMIRYKKGQRF